MNQPKSYERREVFANIAGLVITYFPFPGKNSQLKWNVNHPTGCGDCTLLMYWQFLVICACQILTLTPLKLNLFIQSIASNQMPFKRSMKAWKTEQCCRNDFMMNPALAMISSSSLWSGGAVWEPWLWGPQRGDRERLVLLWEGGGGGGRGGQGPDLNQTHVCGLLEDNRWTVGWFESV